MDLLPDSNEDYETKEYWDRRYSESLEANFDWFKSYSQISHLFSAIVKPEHRILILGCGNSTLSEEMYDAGYESIVNVDFSSTIIEKMKTRHSEKRPKMEWLEMDVRALAFENGSFDIAIDKGTMDAMMTVKGDVWVIENCNKEVDEVIRVLRPGGHFLYLTFGQPHFRRRYLQRPNTTLKITEIGEAFHYYLYTISIL